MALVKILITLGVLLTTGLLILGAGKLMQVTEPAGSEAQAQSNHGSLAGSADGPRSASANQVPADRYGDPLPPGALARLGTVRWRHEFNVRALAFSPHDRILATSSSLQVALWEVATGRELRRLPVATLGRWGQPFHFSRDAGTLAVAGEELTGNQKQISFWDVASGRRLRSLPLPIVRGLLSVCFSPDGKLLAECGENDQAFLIEVATGKLIRQIGGHRASIYGLAFSPDSSMLALGTLDPSVQLWDVKNGKRVRTIDHHGHAFVFAVAFSPDSKLIASSSFNTIIVSDVATGKEVSRFQEKMPVLYGLAFTPDGNLLFSTGEDGPVRIWDLKNRKLLTTVDGGFGCGRALALSHKGRILAQGTDASALRLWDMATLKRLFTDFEGHDTAVNCVAFAPNGKQLVSAGNKQQLLFWAADTWKPVRTWKESARSVSFAPGGERLALVPAYENVLRIKELGSGESDRQLPLPDTGYPWRAVFAQAGRVLVSVDSNRSLGNEPKGTGRVLVWETATGRRLRSLLLPGVIPTALAVTRDGRTAFVGDNEGAIHYCNLEAGAVTRVMQGHRHEVSALALSPDDWLLASGSLDRSVRLWERLTGRELVAFRGHKRALGAVAFSPSGRLVASAGGVLWCPYPEVDQPRKIRIWDAVTGQEVAHFQGHDSDVTSLDFSPQGDVLASGLGNTTVLVWKMPENLRRLPLPRESFAADLSRLWHDLAASDALHARRAIWSLVANPDAAVDLLRSRLRPPAPTDAKLVQQWIADLGSNQFATREKASRALERLGGPAIPALDNALRDRPALEARRRIEQLAREIRMSAVSGELLQSLRAVEVLQRIGTPKARALLETFAKGVPGHRLTQEALLALERPAGQAR